MRYRFIRGHQSVWPVATQCRVLGVSRGGYYDWGRREPSPRQVRRDELSARASAVFAEHRGRYGAPRVHAELAARGERACRNTVAKVLRAGGLAARRRRRFVPRTTDSSHGLAVAGNLLGRDFSADAPDRKWVCDITYIPTAEGWLYLAAVLDLFSRRVVGFATADHLRAELPLAALDMALTHRSPPADLLHHSDRGSQYAGGDYQARLAGRGLTCSMSRAADCYDNAAMESFWATLKGELIDRERYPTRRAAEGSIFEYIEVYYNRERRHSTLGYQTPAGFEAGHQKASGGKPPAVRGVSPPEDTVAAKPVSSAGGSPTQPRPSANPGTDGGCANMPRSNPHRAHAIRG